MPSRTLCAGASEILCAHFLLIKSSAVRSWLAKNRFQRMRRAANVIKRGWRKWKVSTLVQESTEIERPRVSSV